MLAERDAASRGSAHELREMRARRKARRARPENAVGGDWVSVFTLESVLGGGGAVHAGNRGGWKSVGISAGRGPLAGAG